MAEINVKIAELDNAIIKLQGLQAKCDSVTLNVPNTVGGGQVINELENVAAVYKMMNKEFGELISNTISFMQNVKKSFETSDKNAANSIKSG